jgi:hypothetical protein
MVSPISHARPDRAAIPTFERSPPPLPSLFPRKRDFVARDFAANTRCCAPLGLLRDRHGLKKPVIVRLDSRDLVWINVTANPTAEWIARQLAEAFPWNAAPRYLVRDRDQIYGTIVTHRLRAMGIRDKPVAPASP